MTHSYILQKLLQPFISIQPKVYISLLLFNIRPLTSQVLKSKIIHAQFQIYPYPSLRTRGNNGTRATEAPQGKRASSNSPVPLYTPKCVSGNVTIASSSYSKKWCRGVLCNSVIAWGGTVVVSWRLLLFGAVLHFLHAGSPICLP